MEASESNLGLLSCPKIFTYTGADKLKRVFTCNALIYVTAFESSFKVGLDWISFKYGGPQALKTE